MAWYAYCIAERNAFPELCRHRRPMPFTGVTGLFGNQIFQFALLLSVSVLTKLFSILGQMRRQNFHK